MKFRGLKRAVNFLAPRFVFRISRKTDDLLVSFFADILIVSPSFFSNKELKGRLAKDFAKSKFSLRKSARNFEKNVENYHFSMK